MRSVFIIFSFLIIYANANGQRYHQKLNSDFVDLINGTLNQDSIVDFFVVGDILQTKKIISQNKGIFKYSIGDISSVRLPVRYIFKLDKSDYVRKIIYYDNSKFIYCNDTAIVKNKVDKVHNGTSPLTQPYTGKNVIIGLIEKIDYRHPDFLDSLGRTRILYYWDSVDTTGTPPSGFGYGREFNSTEIDQGLADSSIIDTQGHGTSCAGVACGNGRANGLNRGAAPDANLIIAPGSSPDKIKYIFDKAASLGRPCVISISYGLPFYFNQIEDVYNIIMDSLVTATPGRAIVVAAGNWGDMKTHYNYPGTTDTLIGFFRENSPYNCYSCDKSPIICGEISELNNIYFSLTAYKDSMLNPVPSFSTPFYNFSDALTGSLLIMCPDTSHGRNIVGLAGDTIGNYGWMLLYEGGRPNCDSASTYFWKISVTGPGHANIDRMHSISVDTIPSPAIYPEFQNYMFNDNMCNINGLGISDKVITVGYAQNRNSHIDYNGNISFDPNAQVDQLLGTSAHGPTYWGVIKPDITGVANYIMTAYPLANRNYMITNEPWRIDSGGYHSIAGGSSMAAPLVAGGIALYFEKYPNATWLDVKNAIINCPTLDNFTGVNLPDNSWGYGKFNAFGMLTNCAPIYIEEQNSFKPEVFPNPSSNTTTFYCPAYINEIRLQIYSTEGKILYENKILGGQKLLLENFASGLYFYKFTTEHGSYGGKFIIQ